jgi:phage shock protein C
MIKHASGVIDLTKRLYRSRKDRVLWGVCGGLGQYFNIDPVIFRIIFVVTIFVGMSGALVYVIMTLIVPEEP